MNIFKDVLYRSLCHFYSQSSFFIFFSLRMSRGKPWPVEGSSNSQGTLLVELKIWHPVVQRFCPYILNIFQVITSMASNRFLFARCWIIHNLASLVLYLFCVFHIILTFPRLAFFLEFYDYNIFQLKTEIKYFSRSMYSPLKSLKENVIPCTKWYIRFHFAPRIAHHTPLCCCQQLFFFCLTSFVIDHPEDNT